MGSDLNLNNRDMSPARSRRSTSYCGSGPPTPTPLGSSRRSSLAMHNHHSPPLPSIPQAQPLPSPPPLEPIEVYAEPVDEGCMGDRVGWEFHHVAVTRVSGYGFGIAVSGGRDNPHFANGDPSIAVSDVLKAGPAEDKLQVNDRILSVNGISLENVEYATAVQVLRDSGNTVTLVIKRRAAMLPGQHSRSHSYGSNMQSIKATLTKNSKKEDFGIVLGCRLFIKELSSKAREQLNSTGQSLAEGDILTRINNTNCNDLMSLKEARKIMDGCKERLSLVVSRDIAPGPGQNNMQAMHNPNATSYSHNPQNSHCSIDDTLLSGPSYSSQNLYVVPPTRPAHSTLLDDKSNLLPRGRSRNPLLDVSLSQLDRPSTPPGHSRSRSAVEEPPRPPPPRVEDYYSSRKQLFEEDPLGARNKQPVPEPRYITFQKEGSVGIRLTGGNEVGIFVTAVQPGSPASLQGLTPGDKILKVNDMDMKGVTREEAVLFLLSLQEQIDLIVQHCKEEYDHIVASQKGDSFNVKTHFHYSVPLKGEASFRSGDVFRVLDTLHNGVVGAWQVLRIGRNNQEMQKGVIPNKARAEELATAQFNATKKELSASESRGNFFRRRRSSHRRSKSLSREHWDDVVFSDSVSKFPAYERVVLRHPGFMRPVVLFGAISDLARDRLLKDFPDKFTAPQLDNNMEELSKSPKQGGIIRLSGIRDIMDRGRHALLDITPNAVDRLNYAQFYPIVIFLKADSKHTIKQHRHGMAKSAHKSSKKLLEQSIKVERVWGHVFSGQVTLGEPDTWYRKLRDLIDQLQAAPVWVSETKPEESLSDDFLFPMTSRLSYASSPESDLELSPGPHGGGPPSMPPRMVKASSDPSIATTQDNLDRDNLNLNDAVPPPYTSPYEHTGHTRRSGDSKYGFSAPGAGESGAAYPRGPPNVQSQGIYGVDLPPRVDRGVKPSPSGPRNPPASGGTLSRSAQERLFGNKGAPDTGENADDSVFAGGNRTQSGSLDRHRGHKGVGSYDSVSSYDSYNNPLTRDPLGLSSTRLGPNAPDDLKSVPPGAKFEQLSPRNSNSQERILHEQRNSNSLENRNSNSHESNRNSQEINNRNFHDPNRNPHDMNRNSHEQLSPRSSQDGRSHDPYRFTRSTAQPIGPEGPPRKPAPLLETKTDYGKYSRNNSTSQADYKPTKPPPLSPGGPASYKPVPPPKPKNYRPPAQGWSEESPSATLHHAKSYSHNGHAQNGMDQTPRSPNGYGYYNTNQNHQPWSSPNHTHSMSQPMPGGHTMSPPPSMPNQGGGHYSQGYGHSNTYGHNGMNSLNNPPHYMQRTPHAMSNAHMQADRHHGNSLDLAGSREQRGSAFELYRKPQAISHHHNMSKMDQAEEIEEQQLPPNSPRKKLLPKKSPLANLKEMFKGSKTLKRQNSLCEKETNQKPRPILRRQNSMLEKPTRFESPLQIRKTTQSIYENRREIKHEPFYQTRTEALNYEPIFQSRDEAIYQSRLRENIYQSRTQMQESPYANRFELRQQLPNRNESPYMTRKQIEERIELERQRRLQNYQTRKEVMSEPPYMSKKELRESVYQTKKEVLREPIYQTRMEVGGPIYESKREALYVSRGDIVSSQPRREVSETIYETKNEALCERDPIYTTHQEMREQVYQMRREALESKENEMNRRNQEVELNKTQILQGEALYHTRFQKQQHLSNIIKKTGAPESPYESRTSVETQYISQYSLKTPNAHSTPYASQFSLQNNLNQNKEMAPPVLTPNGNILEPVTCSGQFGPEGGTLKDDKWGVSLVIPKGAIPPGPPQNVYFTVTDPRHSNVVGKPPLDCENGEAMLSPLVMCGPQGLDFLEPVTLNIPHYASSTASLGLSLKATDSERDIHTDWDNIQLPSNTAANMVSVKVDHF